MCLQASLSLHASTRPVGRRCRGAPVRLSYYPSLKTAKLCLWCCTARSSCTPVADNNSDTAYELCSRNALRQAKLVVRLQLQLVLM